MNGCTCVLLLALAALTGCRDPARPPEPLSTQDLVEPSASSSPTEPSDGIGAGVIVLADAALRTAPALPDTPARQRLIRELGEAGVALAFRDWARARRALDGAEMLLHRYAEAASGSEEADVTAIQLAIDHTRALLPQ